MADPWDQFSDAPVASAPAAAPATVTPAPAAQPAGVPDPYAQFSDAPGGAASEPDLTPEQIAAAQKMAAQRDPNAPEGSEKNPAYDRPGKTGDNTLYRVDRTGKLLLPAGLDAVKGAASGTEQGVAGVADMIGSVVPGVNVLERVTSGGNPLQPDLMHPTGHLFGDLARTMSGGDSDYQPWSGPGKILHTIGEYSPGALLGEGSALARGANVLLPALGSEAAGDVAHAAGAPAWVERGTRVVGGFVGAGGASVRMNPMGAATSDEVAANALTSRAGADPETMTTRANALRDAGVQPTALDVIGSRGQRLVRAVGVTNEGAGETLQNNALTTTSATKPAVMDRTRSLPGGDRTADQVAADLLKARQEEAQTTYAAPYAAPIELKDLDVIQALRDPEGAGAINRAITAARARMDYKAVADLEQLKATANGPTGNGQVWPTTGRALDRVQIAFGNKGAALAQNGSNDIASGMFMRQDRINGLLDQIPGLSEARAAYRAKSQAIDLLQKPGAQKDPFSTDPTDYEAWISGLSPEAKAANQVAIRQGILDTLGGQRSSTVGSIDELATSPYVKKNLATALGSDEASSYLDHLNARLQQRANASVVSPNAGSRTAVLQNDIGNALTNTADALDMGHRVVTGNAIGVLAKAASWWKARGFSDQDAQSLADAATDPARLDGVISAIKARQAKTESTSALPVLTYAGATAATQSQPR